ncbi:class A beta-lactamase [Labrenzia sp. PHM005]|uniref:class A beta-lactamase n=1 Tax=Labrenzia sp. PHM005 TaxID=2590016 RepID=UPI00114058F3|nr:class A beta-lactamase [Labrenzia sp. PHM005]QDG79259.1 class A beta-lactamase [Labrenzia sp. PHM005]
MMFRKPLSLGAAALLLALIGVPPALATEFNPAPLQKAANEIENRLKTRIGIAVYDPENAIEWDYNGDQRFPMNSTMKAFACATLLHQVDTGKSDLGQPVAIEEDMIVKHSPVTKDHIGSSNLTYADLCEATVTTSDNTAANLVLQELGGPAGLTAFMRSVGDQITRLDRYEPTLNEGTPGDPRDTTTPRAAAETLYKLVFSNALSDASRNKLAGWLEGNLVGDSTLRAGLPEGWRIGDKTGAGAYGSRGNIAIIWPPNRKPLALVVYLTENKAAFKVRNKAIAEVGAAFARSLEATH